MYLRWMSLTRWSPDHREFDWISHLPMDGMSVLMVHVNKSRPWNVTRNCGRPYLNTENLVNRYR